MNPIKMTIKNFFSHEESEIDFNFKSCLLIGNTEGDYSKSNGSGKSSVFEALLWALFNKSRAPKMSDLVRWGETSASVVLEFETDGERYRVTRSRNNKSRVSAVTFEKLESEGAWIDCSGSTPSLTNSEIEKTIRLDFKTFVNTTYFRQNDASEFAEAEPYRRKEILKSIVDITKWDDWEDSAKKKIRGIKSEIGILDALADEATVVSEKLKKERESMKNCSKQISIIEHNISTEESSYQLFLEELISMKSNLDFDSMEKTKMKIDEMNKRLGRLFSSRSSKENALSKLSSSRSSIFEKFEKIDTFLEGKRVVDVDIAGLSLLKSKVTDLKSEIKYIKITNSNLESKHLEEGSCDKCGSLVSDDMITKFCEEKDLSIKNNNTKIKEMSEELKSILFEIKSTEETETLNRKVIDAIEKRSYCKERLVTLDSEIESISSDIASISDDIGKIETELSLNEEKMSSLKDSSYEDCEKKVSMKKQSLDGLRNSLFVKKKEIGVHEANISQFESRLEKSSDVKKKLEDKRKELDEYVYLKNIFGKNGIQTILLENIIKNHQAIANNVLKEICNEPIQIHMDTQKTSADGSRTLETLDLMIRKDGNILSYNSLSGGEKFRISIALALGLRDLAARFGGTNLNLIMLDEVNSPLDRYGVETLFVNVIEKISERYKTMVITHDESLKEKFLNVIDVCKVNGISSINHSSFED